MDISTGFMPSLDLAHSCSGMIKEYPSKTGMLIFFSSSFVIDPDAVKENFKVLTIISTAGLPSAMK